MTPGCLFHSHFGFENCLVLALWKPKFLNRQARITLEFRCILVQPGCLWDDAATACLASFIALWSSVGSHQLQIFFDDVAAHVTRVNTPNRFVTIGVRAALASVGKVAIIRTKMCSRFPGPWLPGCRNMICEVGQGVESRSRKCTL